MHDTVVVRVDPGAQTYVTFPAGTIGGPIWVRSDQPVLASQRVQYYQSFNEVPSMAVGQAQTTNHLMWFDKATPGMFGDNIHIYVPAAAIYNVHVTLTVPGAAPIQITILFADSESYVTFPAGTIGGPVTITSDQPILAAQRVQYYQTFNEVWAS
jgi:hypothetical protein